VAECLAKFALFTEKKWHFWRQNPLKPNHHHQQQQQWVMA